MNTIQELDITEIVDYICANRIKGAYNDWTREQIEFEVLRAFGEGTCVYIKDNITNLPLGIVTARKLEDSDGLKIMHITGILTSKKELLGCFYKIFRTCYPDYQILGGNRKGRLFAWDVNKIDKHLKGI